MEKKEDRRVALTKRMLKETLTEMLKEQDLYHISIRDLCEKADVNRTTFYKHYGSQFDLLADMENDLLDFISRTIEAHVDDQDQLIYIFCEYLERNHELFKLIINNNIDPEFPQKLFALEPLKSVTLQNYSATHNSNEADYFYNYATYGTFRVFCMWLNKEDRESPEQMVEIIRSLNRRRNG